MQQKQELLEQSCISDKKSGDKSSKKPFVKGSSKQVGIGSPKNVNSYGKVNSPSNVVKSKIGKEKVNNSY